MLAGCTGDFYLQVGCINRLTVGPLGAHLPLASPQMRLIAFITEGTQIRRILEHMGVDSEPAQTSPARGPPLWDDSSDAQMDDGVQIEPADCGLAVQPAPDFEADQRVGG